MSFPGSGSQVLCLQQKFLSEDPLPLPLMGSTFLFKSSFVYKRSKIQLCPCLSVPSHSTFEAEGPCRIRHSNYTGKYRRTVINPFCWKWRAIYSSTLHSEWVIHKVTVTADYTPHHVQQSRDVQATWLAMRSIRHCSWGSATPLPPELQCA